MADFRRTFDVIDGIKTMHVDSSNLESIGYDDDAGAMVVSFRNGSAYRYANVPEGVFLGLMRASSHGRYFWSNVRPAGFDYERIRAARPGSRRVRGEPLWPRLGRAARRMVSAVSDLTGGKPAARRPQTTLGGIVAGLARRKSS